jgi:hypothetical protein
MFWLLRWPRRAWRWSLFLLALAAWLLTGVAVFGYLTPVPRETIPLQIRDKETILFLDTKYAPAFFTKGPSDKLTLWDAQSGARLSELQDQPDPTGAVAFPANGKTVALGEAVWDSGTGRWLFTLPRAALGFQPGDVAYSPDGRTLAIVYRKLFPDDAHTHYIGFWDVETRKERARVDCPGARKIQFSPDGNTLAVTVSPMGGVGGFGNSLLFYDFATLRPRLDLRLPGRSTYMVFSPDGRRLAIADSTGPIQLYDTASGVLLATSQDEAVHHGLMFSPDGKTLAFWNVHQDKNFARVAGWIGERWAERIFPSSVRTTLLDGRTGKFDCRLPGQFVMAFRPDGTLVALKDDDDKENTLLQVWDIPPARALRPLCVCAAFLLALGLTTAWWRQRRRV